MADKTSATRIFNIPDAPPLDNGLIYISAAAQRSEELTSKNRRGWRAQFEALLRGFDLIGYVDGSKPSPPATVIRDSQRVSNPAYVLWHRQDQLLLHAILTSLSQEYLFGVTKIETAKEAWDEISKDFLDSEIDWD